MPATILRSTILRFALGLGSALLATGLLFREVIFDPRHPAFFLDRGGFRLNHPVVQCVVVGALLAGLLALMRSDQRGRAAWLALGFALLRLGFAHSEGWTPAVAGALQAGGAWLVALIFDLLARRGVLFGKFLVLGPLLGGVYLATTPVAVFFLVTGSELMPTLMRQVFLGLLVGDSVGLGVEVADLLVLVRAARRHQPAG